MRYFIMRLQYIQERFYKKVPRFPAALFVSMELGFQVDAGLLVEDVADIAAESEVDGINLEA